MSEQKTTQPLWKSNVDSGYFQMLSIYGGEEKEEAKTKAKSEFGFALQSLRSLLLYRNVVPIVLLML